MSDSVQVTGFGKESQARAQAHAAAQQYINQGYRITNETFVPQGGMSGCMLVLILIVLFITIIGLLLLPFLLMGEKNGTYTVTLTRFDR